MNSNYYKFILCYIFLFEKKCVNINSVLVFRLCGSKFAEKVRVTENKIILFFKIGRMPSSVIINNNTTIKCGRSNANVNKKNYLNLT